jgi:predicted ATP-dependent serine protease
MDYEVKYRCVACGRFFDKWSFQCPKCKGLNSLAEDVSGY